MVPFLIGWTGGSAAGRVWQAQAHQSLRQDRLSPRRQALLCRVSLFHGSQLGRLDLEAAGTAVGSALST
jgi:hypothetical protein